MSRIFGGLCLFLIILFTPALTRADPIVVTSGTVTVTGISGGAVFNLAGENFSATSAGGDSGNFVPASICFPCVAGTSVAVGGTFLGLQIGGGGTANINGTLFTNVGWSGELSLLGGSVIVPSTMSNVALMVPFTFNANLNGCSGGCLVNPAIFSVMLVGSGTATLELTFSGLDQLGRPIFTFRRATFQFEEVPEPASILLLGGGLALLTAKLRRRVSSQNDSGNG